MPIPPMAFSCAAATHHQYHDEPEYGSRQMNARTPEAKRKSYSLRQAQRDRSNQFHHQPVELLRFLGRQFVAGFFEPDERF